MTVLYEQKRSPRVSMDTKEYMTRIYDGSPPIFQTETSTEGEGPPRSTPSHAVTPPIRGVFVPYVEFKERQAVRRRVMAALEKSREPVEPR